MKSIFIAGALALGLFGFTDKAHAQFVTGTGPYYNPYTGSYVNQGTVYGFGAAQNVTTYYNPYSGNFGRRVVTQDVFGNTAVQRSGYNPFYGAYNRGYYANPYTNSFYRYGYRW
jgi:predicted alpha/beta hydrolase